MKPVFLLFLLAALPATLSAQGVTPVPPRSGDLVGARPTARRPVVSHVAAAQAPGTSENDPVQQHLLQTTLDLHSARAEQLPELYERFIATTRDERRQWNATRWAAASRVLARMDQRYSEVRTELPIEERLRIRAFQGEFHTLRGTRSLQSSFEK